jgi:hypothetical protein
LVVVGYENFEGLGIAMVDSSAFEPSTKPSSTQHMEVEEISGANEEEHCNFSKDQLREKQ